MCSHLHLGIVGKFGILFPHKFPDKTEINKHQDSQLQSHGNLEKYRTTINLTQGKPSAKDKDWPPKERLTCWFLSENRSFNSQFLSWALQLVVKRKIVQNLSSMLAPAQTKLTSLLLSKPQLGIGGLWCNQTWDCGWLQWWTRPTGNQNWGHILWMLRFSCTSLVTMKSNLISSKLKLPKDSSLLYW